MARPTDCTPEIIAVLAQSVEDGLSIERACDLVEISRTSYQSWSIRGETGEEPFATFLTSIKKARAKRLERRIKRMEECANDRISLDAKGGESIVKGDWQALAWLNERQEREEFGRNVTRLKLTEAPENFSEVEKINFMSNDILKRMARGELTAEEAALASQVIEQRRKCLEQAGLSNTKEKEIPTNLGSNAIDAAKKYQEIMG